MTSKNRAALRALANGADTILHIGKSGIGENVIRQLDSALTARELVKGRVQAGSELTAREAGEELARLTDSEVVQVIGARFVLYRRNEENPVICV